MVFADYPGHVIAGATLLLFAALLVWAYRSDVVRQVRAWRWLLFGLQYGALAALIVILWNPSRTETAETTAKNTVMVVFDTSRSMSIADESVENRLDNAIAAFKQCFAPANPDGPEYAYYGFDWRCYRSDGPDGLRRWGDQTNLHPVLALLRKYDVAGTAPTDGEKTDQGRVVGALVFTDGQAAEKNVQAYSPMQGQNLAVAFVGVGSAELRTDLAVRTIRAPAKTVIGTAYCVETLVAAKGESAGPIRVELLDDELIVDYTDLAPGALDAKEPLEFWAPADTLGSHCVTVRIRGAENEINWANNVRRTMVEVVDEDKLRVLFYSDTASFDIGKIRQALERDTKIRLDFGFDAIMNPRPMARDDAMSGHVPLPEDKAGFCQYDVIVLGSCPFDNLSIAQLEGLYGFVAERGGGLVLVPGRASRDAAWAKNRLVRALLPVESSPASAMGGARQPQLTLAGLDSGIVGERDLEEHELEVSLCYDGVRKKPAATTLLMAGDTPLVCVHRVGRGRVALLNARNLFRLYREDLGGGFLQKLFSGLIAHVGRTGQLEAGVELFAKRDADEPRKVRFDAYVYDNRFDLVADANVLLDIGGNVVRMDEAGKGQYTVQIDNVVEEAVVARAEAEVDGYFLGQKTLAATLPLPRSEMDDVELDRVFLRSLAERISAQYFDAEALDEDAAGMFAAAVRSVTKGAATPVWPNWPLLLALCALLSALWFIRRSLGLM